MTRLDKLIRRVCGARPTEAKFSDVERLLLAFGYEKDRQKGSHVIFKKEDVRPFTVPLVKGTRVKRFYLARLCELLGLDDQDEN